MPWQHDPLQAVFPHQAWLELVPTRLARLVVNSPGFVEPSDVALSHGFVDHVSPTPQLLDHQVLRALDEATAAAPLAQ